MGRIKDLLCEEDEGFWRFQIENLDEKPARARRRAVQEEISQAKARLALLINASIQYELDRLPGTDGIEVIASVASIPVAEVWRLLAGNYRPTEASWARIQQILMVCQASHATEKVLAAEPIFKRLSELHEEQELLSRRLHELDQRRRGTAHGMEQRPSSPRTADPVDPPSAPAASPGKPAAPGDDMDKIARKDIDTDAGPLTYPLFTPAAIPDLPDVRLPDSLQPLRPDPMMASNRAMFADMMRAYRIWAGNPSYRVMERRCAKKVSYSTFRNILNSATMPAKLDHVEAIVRVLGGTAEDLQRWVTAWRRLAMVADAKNTESTDKKVSDRPDRNSSTQ